MLESLGLFLLVSSTVLVVYTYLGYPIILKVVAPAASEVPEEGEEAVEWPMVSVTVPAYNEEARIGEALEHILALDYPSDRMEVAVVSDGSTDRTEEIVRGFEDRGVTLHRMPERGGKTAAENWLAPRLKGEIVLNTDASIRIRPDAIKRLVRPFLTHGVGLASGRDVSVSADSANSTEGESRYVGYEMGIRSLETRAGGIVGASGCLYAIRADLHRYELPPSLSRDFCSALVARSAGYLAVSVEAATCLVPRTHSIRKEYRRKVRTMVRGMRTLAYKRSLLNPFTQGWFAWKLFSHKVCRWASSWALLGAALGLLFLALSGSRVGLAGSFMVAYGGLAAAVVWLWPEHRELPRAITLPGFAIWSNVAAMHASLKAPLGGDSAKWEPTRRKDVSPAR